MLTFLEVNGIKLDYTDEDLIQIGLSAADGSMTYEALLGWIIHTNIGGLTYVLCHCGRMLYHCSFDLCKS